MIFPFFCMTTVSPKHPKKIMISNFFLHTFLALSPGEVWTLDRGVFQQIMMQTGMKKIEEKLNFLKSVPIFSKMSNDILLRLSDALEVVSTISLEKNCFYLC